MTSVIQPSKTTSSRDFVFPFDPRHEFLPGNRPKIAKVTCGRWMWRGCLEYERHGKKMVSGQLRLTGGMAKAQDVVEKYELSCGQLSCPICYEKACGKLAVRVHYRMSQFKRGWGSTKYYHWAVSVPLNLYYRDWRELRTLAYKISKMAGIQGGSVIYHHLRSYNEEDLEEDLEAGFNWIKAPASWYYSPHFHVLGVGFTSKNKVEHTYKKTGWIVKNLGERESLKATAQYQLSHAYIPLRGHALTWFGCMSYNKLKVGPLPLQEHNCPECGSKFRKLDFVSLEAKAIVESMVKGNGVYRFDHGFFRYVHDSLSSWGGYG